MPISSFYGLQTSLRGLLAQQRMLDTAGHNIANASTQGYSRQEVNLIASPAHLIPAGGTAGGGLASLGSGVDVQNYRRVRDGFLDHLTRLMGGEEQTGYRPPTANAAAPTVPQAASQLRTLDLQA